MKQTIIGVVVLIVLVAGGWYLYSTGAIGAPGTSGNATTTSTVVATVNGQNITYGQLVAAETQLGATTTEQQTQAQGQALDSLISLTLLQQAAAQAGFTASSTEVDAQIAAAKQQLGDQGYQDALKKQGLTEDQLRTQISQNLAVQAYLAQTLNLNSITATNAEITDAYNQIKAASGTSTPALAQVKDQVSQLVVGQKQQQLIQQKVQQLRASATIKTFI